MMNLFEKNDFIDNLIILQENLERNKNIIEKIEKLIGFLLSGELIKKELSALIKDFPFKEASNEINFWSDQIDLNLLKILIKSNENGSTND